MKLEHVATKDVTEAIARAMECADKMKTVVILYETHEDNQSASGGVIVADDCSLSKMNWLLDMGKWWIFGEVHSKE